MDLAQVYSFNFKPDGRKLYILDRNNNGVVQYRLDKPWDISSAHKEDCFSYNIKTLSVPAFNSMTFSKDGTHLYITYDYSTYKLVLQFNLSLPWEVSTAAYISQYSVSAQSSYSRGGIAFNNDGTKMYLSGYEDKIIKEYNLASPWILATASYADKFFSFSAQFNNVSDFYVSKDGKKLYVLNYSTKAVYQYILTAPWDITTAVYSNKNFYVGNQENYPFSMSFKPDGTKLYISGNTNREIFQYSIKKD